jgi:hypothetical protein
LVIAQPLEFIHPVRRGLSRERATVCAGSGKSEPLRFLKEMNILSAHQSSSPICPAMQSVSAMSPRRDCTARRSSWAYSYALARPPDAAVPMAAAQPWRAEGAITGHKMLSVRGTDPARPSKSLARKRKTVVTNP